MSADFVRSTTWTVVSALKASVILAIVHGTKPRALPKDIRAKILNIVKSYAKNLYCYS